MEAMGVRTERDPLGDYSVPSDAYYGVFCLLMAGITPDSTGDAPATTDGVASGPEGPGSKDEKA